MILTHSKHAKIFPLHCPEIKITNRLGFPDSYVPMNPALYIDIKGNFILLIRMVNYRKFSDLSFFIAENSSNSKYMILRGENIEMLMPQLDKISPLGVKYDNNKVYQTYWKGVEDIRFINSDKILVTIPELHPHGVPSVFSAQLCGNTIAKITSLTKSDLPEKNWMPIAGTDMVIYQLYPFIIKNIISGETITLSSMEILKDYHGSTNSVIHNSKHIFIIHKGKEHRWIMLNQDFTNFSISPPFTFFANTYIEFCCSLSKYHNDLYIALGVNDKEAYIISVPESILTTE
jgi:hypothetical protein